MTALRKYLRLESPGLWRENTDAQLREVIVGLREATLVLSDPKTEMALTQWSLPALARLNGSKTPGLYGPGGDDGETLEIDDADMLAALETVRAALERRRPKRGRLQRVASVRRTDLQAWPVFCPPDLLCRVESAPSPAHLAHLSLVTSWDPLSRYPSQTDEETS